MLIELQDFWALYVMIFIFYFLGEKTLYVKVKLLVMFVIGCYGFSMSIQRQLMIYVQESFFFLKVVVLTFSLSIMLGLLLNASSSDLIFLTISFKKIKFSYNLFG